MVDVGLTGRLVPEPTLTFCDVYHCTVGEVPDTTIVNVELPPGPMTAGLAVGCVVIDAVVHALYVVKLLSAEPQLLVTLTKYDVAVVGGGFSVNVGEVWPLIAVDAAALEPYWLVLKSELT